MPELEYFIFPQITQISAENKKTSVSIRGSFTERLISH